jgi:hypothetical protein
VAILVLDGKILFAEKEFRQQTILPLVFFVVDGKILSSHLNMNS